MRSITKNLQIQSQSSSHYQSGWTAIASLVVIISAGCGAVLFDQLYEFAGNGLSKAWLTTTLILLPFGVAVQCLWKLFELYAPDGNLTRRERDRLKGIVDEKVRQIIIAITFYVITAAISIIVFWLGASKPIVLASGMPIVGGLLAISLVSLGFLVSEMRHVSRFKGTLKQRDSEREQRAKLRTRLLSRSK